MSLKLKQSKMSLTAYFFSRSLEYIIALCEACTQKKYVNNTNNWIVDKMSTNWFLCVSVWQSTKKFFMENKIKAHVWHYLFCCVDFVFFLLNVFLCLFSTITGILPISLSLLFYQWLRLFIRFLAAWFLLFASIEAYIWIECFYI